MMAKTTRTWRGSRINTPGSNSMPTETKNKTEKESLSGKVSSAARWLRGDSLITTPAKKAPSAKETPNKAAEPYAIPTAAAMTHRVKSSREPVCAICQSSHGQPRADYQHECDN